jgi:hypothetical protein
MTMPIILGATYTIANILNLILWIIVLIKMFKKEGALKGILGFFCGIYLFIWGWIKHKQLAMTKLMAVWSLIILLEIVLIPVIGVDNVLDMRKNLGAYTGVGISKLSKPDSGSGLKNKLTKKKAQNNQAQKPSQTKPGSEDVDKDVDWSLKAMALWNKGKFKDPQKAVDYWGRAISNEQHTLEAYNNRGLAYHELKRYDKAIKDFSQAINLDPDYAAAYNNRGGSHYERNEYQLALADFNQSLKRKPNYAKAHLNRGLVYYQMDKTGQACREFQKACDHGDCEGTKWAVKNAICK